jgi:cytochrome P450
LGFLMDVRARFGDVVDLGIPMKRVVLIHDPEALQHVFRDNYKNYTKDTLQYRALATITGNGLLTSDGEHWRRQRRLQQPAFSRAKIDALDAIVVPTVDSMLDRWETFARDGTSFDVDAEMMRLALEVVGRALFGIDLGQQAPALTRAVLAALDFIVHRARHPFTPPLWVPTTENRAFARSLRELDRAVRTILEERRRRGSDERDVLGLLLAARDPDDGRPMSDGELRDEVLTLLIAGHETVASALTWTWLLLAQHPAAGDAVREEVLGTLGQRAPTSADLARLPLLRGAFAESLRLYPPAWVISRKAIAADVVRGYAVPAGALVVVSTYVLHRRAASWETPERFLPSRFVGESEHHRFSYLPFGGGPRVCIGNEFALTEAALVLARVIQRMRLSLSSEASPQVDALVTLRPRGGLWVRARLDP